MKPTSIYKPFIAILTFNSLILFNCRGSSNNKNSLELFSPLFDFKIYSPISKVNWLSLQD